MLVLKVRQSARSVRSRSARAAACGTGNSQGSCLTRPLFSVCYSAPWAHIRSARTRNHFCWPRAGLNVALSVASLGLLSLPCIGV